MHAAAKRALLEEIKKKNGMQLEEPVMTIGFARRATAYKRANLLFTDLARLGWIAERVGPFQVVLGGKAHFQVLPKSKGVPCKFRPYPKTLMTGK